ncbi:hypothetical protein SAMD00079811_52110 [Scytonema sp. HK-05]|uniref:FG-GAP-like repeat-containing protein n=1 Tax=Scytonema sp. HK-05 TaxID=1137095 RepID=UPI000937149E|nr:FG-GAP-like repeat-containing protein [Scytonema sp. HK-05]OKH56624.1 hypothetical protein NIES2130_24535 [Scytonema sp. HK-05]BAY47593.1 hypothetical protein SAMD00079811_52110 [Scytonema sp. HK-05]
MVQTLTVSGTTNYTTGANPRAIAPNLSITDPDNGNLNGASVIITSNFNPNEDRLSIAGETGTTSGSNIIGTIQSLNWNYNTTTGVLTFTGTATNDVYQNVLRQVTYSNTNNTPSAAARGIQFALGTNLANPENNHFYEFVPNQGIAWTSARLLAENRRDDFNRQGYLATITSATEQNFVQSKVQGNGWIGGTDGTTEGDWRWVTGPEAGTQGTGTPFWLGGIEGSTVGGQYSNWESGEPNDGGNLGEDYAHIIGNPNLGQPAQGKWNDLGDVVEPGNYQPQGYIVEYGGLQGDPTNLQVTGNVTVTLNSSKSDFNRDGRPDILWRNYRTGENAIWTLNSSSPYYDPNNANQGVFLTKVDDVNWEIEGQADFNKDGNVDILWRNYSTGENAIWQMNGTTYNPDQGVFLTQVPDKNWEIEGVADFNKDGNVDILWRNYSTGENAIWQMNGTTYNPNDANQGVFLPKVDDVNWQVEGLADFNKDGNVDILWRNSRTGENAIWKMNGTTYTPDQGVFLTQVPDKDWQIQGTADFDKDSNVDILWRNSRTGENAIWKMNGTTYTPDQGVFLTQVPDQNWEIAGLEDFNKDGNVDILWRNYSTGENAIWQMNGTTYTPDQGVFLTQVPDKDWQIASPSSNYSLNLIG